MIREPERIVSSAKNRHSREGIAGRTSWVREQCLKLVAGLALPQRKPEPLDIS